MNQTHNGRLTGYARRLRREMTKEERHLWYDFFKSIPVMVHRQKVIGQYVVDFYIAEAKLAVELDGSQHYEIRGAEADCKRDADLKDLGITVLRYSNADVNYRFEAVCQDIWDHVFKPSP